MAGAEAHCGGHQQDAGENQRHDAEHAPDTEHRHTERDQHWPDAQRTNWAIDASYVAPHDRPLSLVPPKRPRCIDRTRPSRAEGLLFRIRVIGSCRTDTRSTPRPSGHQDEVFHDDFGVISQRGPPHRTWRPRLRECLTSPGAPVDALLLPPNDAQERVRASAARLMPDNRRRTPMMCPPVPMTSIR
jgi:hypothetical protein